MASKVDWDYHRENYNNNYANQGVSVAEYARKHDLNPNSARRSIKATGKASKAQIDQKKRSGDQKGSDRKTKGDRTAKPDRAVNESEEKQNRPAKKPSKRGKPRADYCATNPLLMAIRDAETDLMIANGGGFMKNHKMSLRSGTSFDVDEWLKRIYGQTEREFSLDPTLNLIREEFRLNVMLAIKSSAMEARVNQHALDQEIYTRQQAAYESRMEKAKETGADTSEILPPEPPKPLADMLASVEFASASDIGMCADSIMKNKLKLLKLRQDEILNTEKITITREKLEIEKERHERETGSLDAIGELLASRTEEDLNATDTAYLFVKAGLEPPAVLMAEANKEINDRQPVIDDAKGVSDDELEIEAQKFAEKRHKRRDAVPDRQEALEAIFAEAESDKANSMLSEDDFSDDELLAADLLDDLDDEGDE